MSSNQSTSISTIVGYLLAGGGMLVLAEFSPAFAVGTMSVVLLGMVLTNPDSINTIANLFQGKA